MAKEKRNPHWELGKRLGRGGQGYTYHARRKGEKDYNYVLKELRNQKTHESRMRMHLEVTALEALSGHEGIAVFVDSNADAYKTKDELYLVTEFVKGSHPTGPIDMEHAVTLAVRLLEILEYCHDVDIVHRDIKPQNVILRADDPKDPILLDFGLSFNRNRATSFETEPGQHIGPRSFIDLPELTLASADKRSKKTDVAQVVGLFFYCLTGEPPGPLLDDSAHPPHKREGPLDVISELKAADQVERIFDIGFKFAIDSRWQSATALKEALKDLILPADARRRKDFVRSMLRELELYDNPPDLIAKRRLVELSEMARAHLKKTTRLIADNSMRVILHLSGGSCARDKYLFNGGVQLKDSMHAGVEVEFQFLGEKRDGELWFRTDILQADHDSPITSITKFPFEDPAADAKLKELIEDGLLKAMQTLWIARKKSIGGAEGGRGV